MLSLFIVASTACSASDESDVTVGPQEPATVAELDAAVGPPAQVLLDARGVRITAVYFGIEDPEQAARFDWLEYRADGDYFLVFNERDPRDVVAYLRTGDEVYTAAIVDQTDTPWSVLSAAADPPDDPIELLELVTVIAEQPSNAIGGDAAGAAVSRQQDSEGNVLWTFRKDSADPNVIEFGAQWLINGDGVLRFYRVGSDVEPISGWSGIVYEFGVADDLEPLDPPVLGTPLDLEARGVPEVLIDVSE